MFRKLLKSVRANILVGVILTVPIVATVLIFDFLIRLATNWLPDSAFPVLKTVWNGYVLRFLTLVAVIIFFYVIGVLVRNFLGRRLYTLSDKVLGRIPFFRNIYVSVRQVSESLFTQRKALFKDVVLVQYPRQGLYCLAFVTATAPPGITETINASANTTGDVVSLFIPTTPNPTSGVLILVPRSDIVHLEIPVTDALTFIMSAGAVKPGQPNATAPTLLDKLESWLKQNDDSSPEETHATTALH
ncbi:MAG: DUF502 domain-containing protein [Verrucomicrobia bacterium]|nr:DUF502 domain-containing protein [Verrucomicrobiota bacterium]